METELQPAGPALELAVPAVSAGLYSQYTLEGTILPARGFQASSCGKAKGATEGTQAECHTSMGDNRGRGQWEMSERDGERTPGGERQQILARQVIVMVEPHQAEPKLPLGGPSGSMHLLCVC